MFAKIVHNFFDMNENLTREAFDSDEEYYFYWYLKELFWNGFIKTVKFHPKSFSLSEKITYDFIEQKKTKTKLVKGFLLHPHEYTPDVGIVWDKTALNSIVSCIECGQKLVNPFVSYKKTDEGYLSLIEIKPSFDQNNMTRLFSINQKWMWNKYNIYVQKITPEKLFKQTFTPNRYLLTDKSGKKRTIKFKTRSISEYLKS